MSLKLENKVAILIPALNPKKEFITYVDELIANGFKKIIIVNDGSKEECTPIFDVLNQKIECDVIKHETNKGKGKSLKDGFEHFLKLENFNEYTGIITADCDGQHLVKDVLTISNQIWNGTDALILGSRNLKNDNVPAKSSVGNNITSSVFKILYGENISDTQTGLRGISSKYVRDFINISGDRYEYETNMLIDCILKKIKIVEIPITTVYIDNNADSHFRPIKDSISIYWKILNSFIKYSIVSIVSFLLDIIIFKIIISNIERSQSILIATVLARITSSALNYILNKKVAFKSEKKISTTIIKYYTLCIVQMFTSAIMVTVIFNLTHISETLIKIVVDTIIFIINFRVQRKWIFNE